MKHLLNKVKDSKGFVSLEVIAIAVIIIALAAFVMLKFRSTADGASKSADNQINNAVDNVNSQAGNQAGAAPADTNSN